MALPKINNVTYDLTLPSSGKNIEYRPFLVKEEKILLTALEADDEKQMVKAIKQIMSSCVLSDKFVVDDLPMVDIEYLFLKIRGKAVGDKITVELKCECKDKTIPVEIDLSKVEVSKNENHSDIIKLTDDIMVRLSPPKMEYLMGAQNKNQVDVVLNVVRDSLIEIIQGEDVFATKDHPKKDVEEFIDTLSSGQFAKIQKYYESLPALKHDVTVNCKDCGISKTETLKGLASFFASA